MKTIKNFVIFFLFLTLAACGSGGGSSSSSSAGGIIEESPVAFRGALSPLQPDPDVSTGGSPSIIVISPDKKNAYVLNATTNDFTGSGIAVFNINQTTGALSPASPFVFPLPVSTNVVGMIISPNGRNLYVSSPSLEGQFESALIQISRDSVTGALSLMSPEFVVATDNPGQIAFHPSGNFLYAAVTLSDGGLLKYSVAEDGQLTPISTETTTINDVVGLVVAPNGDTLYVASTDRLLLYSIANNGELNFLSSVISGTNFAVPVISPDGTSLYVTDFGADQINMFSINHSDGSLTEIIPPHVATEDSPVVDVVTADGRNVYATNIRSNSISQFRRDTRTGVLTALTPATVATNAAPIGLATVTLDNGTVMVYATNRSDGSVSMFRRESQ